MGNPRPRNQDSLRTLSLSLFVSSTGSRRDGRKQFPRFTIASARHRKTRFPISSPRTGPCLDHVTVARRDITLYCMVNPTVTLWVGDGSLEIGGPMLGDCHTHFYSDCSLASKFQNASIFRGSTLNTTFSLKPSLISTQPSPNIFLSSVLLYAFHFALFYFTFF